MKRKTKKNTIKKIKVKQRKGEERCNEMKLEN